MSYMARPEVNAIRERAMRVRYLLLEGATPAPETVKQLAKDVSDLGDLVSAMEGPGDTAVTLRMSQYQADNLAKFLRAVLEKPDSTMRTWNTGDWWGELVYMVEMQGGNPVKGNAHGT